MFESEAVQRQFGATAEHGIRESTQGPQCPPSPLHTHVHSPTLGSGYGAGGTPGTSISSVLGTSLDTLYK